LSGLTEIEIYDYNSDESEEPMFILAGNPYKIKAVYNDSNAEDLLYMFTLTNNNLGTVYLNNFTTSPYYIFVPWKGDSYKITVRIINTNSFGYKDISASRQIVSLSTNPPVAVPEGGYAENFFVTGNNALEAKANLGSKYEGYIFADDLTLTCESGVSTTVVYNPDNTMYNDYTYTTKVYWEAAADIQSTSGLVTSADIITSTSYCGVSEVPQNVSYSTTFIENDTIRISGEAGDSDFVYFYWKTNCLAKVNSFDPNFNARVYISNNTDSTASFYRWGSALGTSETLDQKLEIVTVQDTENVIYWTLNNQQFVMNGSSGASIGVYDNNGNAVITKSPNEALTGINMYWLYAIPIYVGGNKYDFSISLVMDAI